MLGVGALVLGMFVTPVVWLMVPAIVVLTVGASFVDRDGSVRDSIRWELSRGDFESTAARLALTDPGGWKLYPDGRLVGLIWVDSIEVYGNDVLFDLPGILDHPVIARDRDGNAADMLGRGPDSARRGALRGRLTTHSHQTATDGVAGGR